MLTAIYSVHFVLFRFSFSFPQTNSWQKGNLKLDCFEYLSITVEWSPPYQPSKALTNKKKKRWKFGLTAKANESATKHTLPRQHGRLNRINRSHIIRLKVIHFILSSMENYIDKKLFFIKPRKQTNQKRVNSRLKFHLVSSLASRISERIVHGLTTNSFLLNQRASLKFSLTIYTKLFIGAGSVLLSITVILMHLTFRNNYVDEICYLTVGFYRLF